MTTFATMSLWPLGHVAGCVEVAGASHALRGGSNSALHTGQSTWLDGNR